MRLISFFIFLLFFKFSHSQNDFYGSYENNLIYYDSSEDSKFEKKMKSNNYLKLNYLLNEKWNFETQLESYTPGALQNFSPDLKKTFVSILSVNYISNKINLTAGSIFDQFGNGLIFRAWEDRKLGINNSIFGLNAKFDYKKISVNTITGLQKIGTTLSNGKIYAIDIKYKFSEKFDVGTSYVGRHENIDFTNEYNPTNINPTTNLISYRINYIGSKFYLNTEIISKSEDFISEYGFISNSNSKKGSAHYLNTGYYSSGIGLDFTFRRLENMSIYSNRNLYANEFNDGILNFIPALTKQYDYSLANINVYQSQPNVSFLDPLLMKAGEIGFQFEFYIKLKKNSFFGGKTGADLNINISNFNNLSGDFSFEEKSYDLDFLNFGQTYFSEQSVNLTKDFSNNFSSIFVFINRFYNKRLVEQSTGKVNSKIIVIDNIFNINDTQSIEFDIQHLFNTNDKKNWFGTGVEYNLNFKNSIFGSYSNNYGNNKQKSFYYNLGVSRTIKNGLFSISYGKQRGGIACFGGICKYYPEYTGVSGTLSLNF